jgi:hypothetical protein
VVVCDDDDVVVVVAEVCDVGVVEETASVGGEDFSVSALDTVEILLAVVAALDAVETLLAVVAAVSAAVVSAVVAVLLLGDGGDVEVDVGTDKVIVDVIVTLLGVGVVVDAETDAV